MSIEAMKLALEALEADEQDMVADKEGHMVFRVDAAITALRQAIEQAEQAQPVAWMMINQTHLPKSKSLHWTPQTDWHVTWEAVPLYTAPPPRQPEQAQPVAWVRRHPDGALTAEFLEHAVIEPARKKSGAWVPLYTAPPQRQPLTDEEIAKEVEAELTHYWNDEYGDTTGARDQLTAFARAIEAAHGIKEQT